MKNENEILKWIIPLVAIVIIFESVVLVSSLTKKGTVSKVTTKIGEIVTKDKKEVIPPAIDLVLSSDVNELKVGRTNDIYLKGLVKQDVVLDAISLFVKYDPTKVELSALTAGKGLAKPTFSKISPKTGYVVMNYFFTTKDGYKIKKETALDLMVFKVKPNVIGDIKFELGTGKDMPESVTMIIDNITGKALPISSNELTIKAVK